MKNKVKLLILKGLPSSGKTTYAKELVAKGWKRVNKDDLRALIDCGKWSKPNEKIIKDIEQNLVFRFLRDGLNVVVDDTNFGYEEMWNAVADTCNAEFEVKFFDTPFLECIERDAKRGEKSVGTKVIQRMYDQYLKPALTEYSVHIPNCWICDIDGTLALTGGKRSHYDYTKVREDIPNRDVVSLIQRLQEKKIKDSYLILVSGREEFCRKDTVIWLNLYNIPFDELFMRATGDNREDSIIKREIYEMNIKGKYNVLGAFDDRNRCVALWRELGLTAFQVNYGNF